MSKTITHPGVVVGVDGSPGSKVALRWAARDAELRHAPLTLVHVVPATAGPWRESSALPEWARRQRADGQRVLDEAYGIVDECTTRGLDSVSCQMPAKHVVSALVDLSRHADLVVVGCLGLGTLRGRHLGSVSSGLTHYAHCPVAVIHDGISLDTDMEAPVLVGIDDSAASAAVAAIAFDEAARRNVGVEALHAWRDVSAFDSVVSVKGAGWPALHAKEEEVLSEALATSIERYPDVPVRRLVVRNDAAALLVDQSQRAQLVVVGSHGSGGFAGMLLGSVSAAVVLLARVPVIVARTAGAQSPKPSDSSAFGAESPLQVHR
jgi:nucleotide-binding universal stress UspA family protein